MRKGTNIFVSYSHKDGKYFDELRSMLAPVIRKRSIDLWHDQLIPPGAIYRQEIQKALDSAGVAVLLVSPDFLNSTFILENELPPLLEAAQKEGLIVFWICLRACMFEATEIEQYQAAYDPSKPLAEMSDSERVMVLKSVCQKLIQATEHSN
jgi:internalin A